MPKVALYKMDGSTAGEIELNDAVFAQEMNEPLVHQAVKMQLANKRQGTQSALTRAEVSGGGKRPWRQKGTGRARHGTRTSPIWRKGGVVFAPKPRDYSQKMPKKMKRKALLCALSAKVSAEEIRVMEDLNLTSGKTKEMATVLKNIDASKKALVVVESTDSPVVRASKNIKNVEVAFVNTINVYDLLKYTNLVATKAAIAQIEEVYGE